VRQKHKLFAIVAMCLVHSVPSFSNADGLSVKDAPRSTSLDSWSGAYVGLSTSGSRISAVSTPTITHQSLGPFQDGHHNLQRALDFSSGGFGGSVSWKRQVGSIVWGAGVTVEKNAGTVRSQVDCQSPLPGTTCSPGNGVGATNVEVSHRVNYSATPLLTVGVQLAPGALLYGAFGFSVANVRTDVTQRFTDTSSGVWIRHTATATSSDLAVAPVLGFGVSYAFLQNVSADVLFLREDFGTIKSKAAYYTGGTVSNWSQTTSNSSQISDNKVRLEIKYKLQ